MFKDFLNENTLSTLLWFIHSWADYKLAQRDLPCGRKNGDLTGLEFDKNEFYNQDIRFIGIGTFQSQWNTNLNFQQAYRYLIEDGVLLENPNHANHYLLLTIYPDIQHWCNISWENEIKPTIQFILDNYCIYKLEVPPEKRSFYNQYIKSTEWREKKEEVLKRDNYKCVDCGNSDNLNIHHLTYDNLGHEPLTDLVTLCQHCHKKRHGLEE